MFDGFRTSWKAIFALVLTELGVIVASVQDSTLAVEPTNPAWWITFVVLPVASALIVYFKKNMEGTFSNPKKEVDGILVSKQNTLPAENDENTLPDTPPAG